jgi:tetratricopeptide (TPR) repeat protein
LLFGACPLYCAASMSTLDPASDRYRFYQQCAQLFSPACKSLSQLVKRQIYFNALFFFLTFGEICFFFSYFALLKQSSVLAISLAIFFLTLFSYFVIRLYLQAKKPEELLAICQGALERCKEWLHYREGETHHHIAFANAAQKFASSLHEKEYTFFKPPFFFHSLSPSFEKLSCFCHWQDLHRMKEFLLLTAIEEHIKVIKCEPTNLELHAALANAYVMLSALYADPRKFSGSDEERWIPKERFSEEMQAKFRKTAERAIEEFQILNDYAPHDPWVHIQLAYSYHDLQMPDKEIQEYEIVLKLRPDDRETLFKLGMLYFQQGHNAKGLQIYQTLKRLQDKKAENLIKFYGAYDIDLF